MGGARAAAGAGRHDAGGWRRRSRVPLLAAAVLAGALACPGCVPREPRTELAPPSQLAGLRRFTMLSGEDARDLIARFHGRSVAPVESHVALYGIPGIAKRHIVLFIARYPNARDSGEQLAAMASQIGTDSGLHNHERLEVSGIAMHAWVGHGLRHYAFARGPQLVWLAAPDDKSRVALAQVLRVKLDAVPKHQPGQVAIPRPRKLAARRLCVPAPPRSDTAPPAGEQPGSAA